MAIPASIRVGSFLVLVVLAQAGASEKVSVTVDPYSLIQRMSVRSVATAEEVEAALEEPIKADIVCHSDGCAEVQAKLATLEAKLKQRAEVDRPEAEAALEKCGKERA